MLFEFIVALLFVVLFSIALEFIIRNPYVVAGIIAIVSLIIFAINFETLTTTFIIWIVIYTIASLVAAFLTEYFSRRRKHGRNGNDNDSCF